MDSKNPLKELKQAKMNPGLSGLKKELFSRDSFGTVLLLAAAVVFLLRFLGISYQIKSFQDKIDKISKKISSTCPGINNDLVEKLNADIEKKRRCLAGFLELFDPAREKYTAGYEASLFFVEQLQQAERALNARIQGDSENALSLGFKNDMPSEKDVPVSLRQLEVLNALVNAGLDAGVKFKSITPLGMTGDDAVGEDRDFRKLSLKLEFSATPLSFAEYIVKIKGIVPFTDIQSINLAKKDNLLVVSLKAQHLYCSAPWRGSLSSVKPLDRDEIIPEDKSDYLGVLRGANPFFVSEKTSGSLPAVELQEAVTKERFALKGSAVFKGQVTAIVTDSLSKKTLFLAEGDVISGFRLDKFSGTEAVLVNVKDSSQKLTLKRRK